MIIKHIKYKDILRYGFIPFILLSMCVTLNAQDSLNPRDNFTYLIEKGISFGIGASLEGYNNFEGGIKRGTAFAATFDANINFDLQKLIGLKNATFYADFEYHAGENPTEKLTGDFQVFDKHNSFPFAQIFEFWYQQRFFDSKLRIKLGKIDANTEFSVIDNGIEFLNSSTQDSPTLFVFPTYPAPAPSINIFFSPSTFFDLKLAMDYANQNAGFLNFYGVPMSVLPTENGVLLLSELDLNWDRFPYFKKDGNFKLGTWHHTGTFTSFEGKSIHGANGIYAILNQTMWQPVAKNTKERGIRMFLEFGLADANLTAVFAHYGGGVVWIGPYTTHYKDALGFSGQYVSLSPNLHLGKHHETNLEVFYKLALTNSVNIKADGQYIINPGGKFRNALVGTMILNFQIGQ